MGWFGEDIYSALTRQFQSDKERKAKELAKATADPATATRISQYRQRHPHLSPGVVLSAAKANLDPSDPAIDRLAQEEAKRKVKRNKGWFSIGDKPIGMNPVEWIGSSWDQVEKAAKTGIRTALTVAQSGTELLQAEARETYKQATDFKSGGPLKAATRLHRGELFGKETLEQTTGYIAAERLITNAEGGAGIGDGYLPRGPAVDEQRQRARESYFIEYADHPLWHQPGDKRVTEQHAGTLGRIAMKDIVQPGSRPYWLLSGIIDAGFAVVADPLAAAGKGAKGLRTVRKAFTPEEAGKQTLGMVDGVRQTIHPPTTQNWLTLSEPGKKFTQWAADNNDAYTVWKTLGGEKGNITPGLALRIADTRSTGDVLNTLGDELGIGLRTKPITSTRQPVGGYLGEVKSSIYENRLFNKMPHQAVRVDDPDAVITNLVRLGRGGELPEEEIGKLFDQAARATDNAGRVNVLREAEVRIAKNISEKLHGPLANQGVNYDRLRRVFENNEAAMQQVIRSQVANRTGVKSITIDGIDIPLTDVHLEGEYLDDLYQLPDPRQMRRMLTTYGRLLNNKVLDVPISALDHIQNVWRGAAIVRPALSLRTGAEEQAWMAGAGYDSLFSHPFSLIAWAMGRKGDLPEHFDAADEISAFSKSQAKSEQWRTRIIGSQKRVIPFTDPEFTKAWSNDIWRLRDDEIARRLAGKQSIDDVRAWLSSDEATEYRRINGVTRDSINGYTENMVNTLKGKTYGDHSLLDAIATGTYGGTATPTFKTAKGSSYTLHPDGTTTRNKAARPEHPGDSGPKPRSARTVFLTKENANKLATPQGEWRVVENNGKLQLVSRTSKDKPWGSAASQRDVPFETAPGKGLYPLELWDEIPTQSAAKAYGKVHFGNPITEISQSTGRPIFAKDPQGGITLDNGFRQHLKKLVDSDISPDHTIGDIAPNRPHPREYYNKFMDGAFDLLLTRPHNYLSASPVFKQAFWKRVDEGIIQANPATQARMIELAEEANMGKDYISALRQRARVGSGNLEEDEYLLWAKAQALEEKKRVITDLSDKSQFLDAMRLVIVFGEAWKQSLTTWARIISENPAVLPRATMLVEGGRGSGFFYTDEQTGEEMMAYPGAGFLTGKLNQALGGANIPFPLQARVESLTMFGANPLLPSAGPVAQIAAGKLLPDTPDNATIRKAIIPYESDPVRLPGWLDKVWTAAFTDPNKSKMYGDLVWDVSRYLKSTGEYDIGTPAGQQALEDKARKTARNMLLFRGLAQMNLPAAPSYQDLAKDIDGHTTLAFTMTKRYQELLEDDRKERTNEAAARFIMEFGENNLLYMQSASKGGEVFTKSGLDWVKRNSDIVDRYPTIYGLLAPSDGGLDMKAYMALFENGQRKPIPAQEAMKLANHRVAKMMQRSAEAKLPPPNKRTDKQRIWLDNLKEQLKDKYRGYDPEFKGDDRQDRIQELSVAIEDPMLARLPQTGAIRDYLTARENVRLMAQKKGITGWETAKAMKKQRQWLRFVAGQLIERTPQFSPLYHDLFDGELVKDTP